MTRAARVAEMQALRAEGLKLREIAARLGVATGTVGNYLGDPDGSRDRARKASYRGTCEQCGASTDGSNGREKAPKLCHNCAPAQTGARRKVWTREALIAVLRSFAEEFGRAPAMADFNSYMTRYVHGNEQRAVLFDERHASGEWPWASTFISEFGTWREACIAAGLTPNQPGHWPNRRDRVAA